MTSRTKRGASVIRISLPYFSRLGVALTRLSDVKPGMKLTDAWVTLLTAQSEVDSLLRTEWFAPAIRSAYFPGQALITALKPLTDRSDWETELTQGETWGIHSKLTEFQTVLNAELGIADCYFVSRKGAFDTASLISAGELCFPPDLPAKAATSIADVRAAAKCLAFEVPTASGFHIMRALEAVIRSYWPVASSGKAHPKNKTMGSYIKNMNDKGYGSAKVRAVLQQIKDLHRNPLAHPDVTLEVDEASLLFGICQSAIAAMLREIPTPPSAPSPLAVTSP